MELQKQLQSLQLFAVILVLFPPFSDSTNTISPIHYLRDGETLISAGQSFALGFFSPGKSKNRYIGIWFNKIPEKTFVWVANRENPVTDSSGILTIKGGNLALVQGGLNNTTLWSTKISSATNDSTATLMDSGNLVLRDDLHRVLWESFDYPAHAWLPNMKIGLDRRTGLNRMVTSWKSPDDPAPGEISFGLDLGGMPQYFLMKGSDRLWRTGPWNGKTFSDLPGMDQDSLYNHMYVDNDDEIYYTKSYKNSPIISMNVLDISGVAQRLVWNDKNRQWNLITGFPGGFCHRYGQCGAYSSCDPNRPFVCTCLRGFEPTTPRNWNMGDWSDGCVRRRPLDCDLKNDGFMKLARVNLPDTSMARVEPALSLKACKEECLKNCSCMAYAAANITVGEEGSGCVIWYGELIDIRIVGDEGQILYTRVAGSEIDIETGILGLKKILIITLVAALVVVTLVTFGYFSWRKSKGHLARERSELVLTKNDFEENGNGLELPMFDLSVIKMATNNFYQANMLGKGGFGHVYKGKLWNGLEIAVKRLSKNSRQGAKEFKNEVALISKLQHRNLVRLLGYCIDKQEKMLIYEHMQNKSLDTFLFDQPKRGRLDWRTRFNIILGIARGVLYLHEDSIFKIIHRDLKASNVLLDDEMNPKISDFGMARIFGREQTFANTDKIAGTYGYMSPEYAMNGRISVKSDVFSFGVILLEIISGRCNNNFSDDCPSMNLIGQAWRLWNEGSILELVDLSIKDSCCQYEVLRCIHVGLLCIQKSAEERPNMSYVVFMLGHETKMPSPKQPAFCFQDYNNERGNYSNNKVTITELRAR